MPHYYVNREAQPNGDHEVHEQGCIYLPSEPNRQYLGEFPSCQPAMAIARLYFPQSDGCYFCCRPCHTS